MDTEMAVSYQAAVPGTPVLTRSGKEIGTLEHVLQVPGSGQFDGIVIATDWGLRFVPADQVELITVRHVRCLLGDAEAARLPPPDGTAVYRVSALDEIGDSLHERLGRMFRRPHWTQG
jgi:PRC-barrel domain protein